MRRIAGILIIAEGQLTFEKIVIVSGAIVIGILLLLLYLLYGSHKKLKNSKKDLEDLNNLMKNFLDTDSSMIYIKDEHLRYAFVNRAMERTYNKTFKEIVGQDDYFLASNEFAYLKRRTDYEVLRKNIPVAEELQWKGKLYKTEKFPFWLQNGSMVIGARITDITADREREKKKEKTQYRHKILADVLTRSFKNREEQLDFVLEEAIKLTESTYGYIYLYDEAKEEFVINSWSKEVEQDCRVSRQRTWYPLESAGLWGEAIRQRKPVVVNDFDAPDLLKRGFPEGHIKIKRFLSVPVTMDGQIVAVIGLANKESEYDDTDTYEVSLLMSGVWNAVERREAQEKLALERNKYLQTLISIGDGVLVTDREGKVEMLNSVAESLTGYRNGEAGGRHYREVFRLGHEEEGKSIKDPIEGVLESDRIQLMGNHAVLHSKDGKKYLLEDSAAPIKDESGRTTGVVLVFRDVTEKKEQRRKIEYLSFHDSLTGLYNRRFFEEELSRLDTERNLPVTIIMGDVNGLKLTNDIFGHSYGDTLLRKVAEVLRDTCREDDIIARWGGDEFVILLPGTSAEDAGKIIERIKEEFSNWNMKSIHGSISMGMDTRTDMNQRMVDVLYRAEEKMYSRKSLERNEFQGKVIDTIITTLHEINPREKKHSDRVSELCQRFGRMLQLPEVDIRKLKDAGYLHDIGKIVLESSLLYKNYQYSEEEWNEVMKHAVAGYRILNSFDNTMDLAALILSHHEQWDGRGYPKGLRGEEIPYLARIISLVESYDRMRYDDEDRETKEPQEIRELLRREAGVRFDPNLTQRFLRMLEEEQV